MAALARCPSFGANKISETCCRPLLLYALRARALLKTAYGTGLRVSETIRLKTVDIDSERMTVRVEQGKGNKDRYTLFSNELLLDLRAYWAALPRITGEIQTRRKKAEDSKLVGTRCVKGHDC